MNHKLLYPAAGVLALAVSPLFAQQADTPAPPAESEAAEVEQSPPADVELTDEETRDAILEFAREVAAQMEAEGLAAPEQEAEQDDDDAAEEAAENTEDDNGDVPAVEGEVVVEGEVEMLELQPAQQGVVVQRAVVVGGNGVQLNIGGPGGLQPRAFDESIAGLPELTLGAVTDGITTDNDPSSYRFDTEGPGLLTVAVRAKEGDDLTIEVYSPNGQMLAQCDIDFGGETGAEHLAVPIPEAGSYRVVVEPLGNGGPFWMGASWLDFEELEAVKPAGPEDAVELTPGQPQDAALDGNETWFTYTAPANGLLIFNTTAEQGDLVLEAYYDGAFDQQVRHSDQDRNGNGANERILMDLAEGQTVFLKARGFGGGQDTEFDVTSRFIEDE